ncbi:MAG: serine hydrolase [Actinobacteria bacterium]|nr:serine hydrolase [Actinomycetota bacterium]
MREAAVGVEGICQDRFAAVKALFEQNFASGDDVGASVALIIDDEVVIDLWGGTATFDGGIEKPWERDTIINVWSTTKTMAALSALVLADRGEIDVDAPVARYWPEFAANGKQGVLVRHLLSHSAGLAGWQEPMMPDDLYDWEKCTSMLAAQAPWWEAGTQSGYHAITQGYLVGEVVRRASGATVGSFFADEIAGPLGADFFIGTPATADARVAHVIAPQGGITDPNATADSIAVRTMRYPKLDASASSTIPWRRAEIPAAGGHGNARSVATVQSIVSHAGQANGVRLLSEAGVARIFDEQTYGQDLVLPGVFRLGVGYGLNCPELPISPNPRTCFWGGWGGSLVVNDLDARMTFAYVMNRMGEGTTGDMRAGGLLMTAYAALAAG